MQYGLIGERLGHSYSAQIHEKLGGYAYTLRELAPEALDSFMREKAFRGMNVTIPYKQAVLPYCDEVDPAAARIGAVNTIVNRDGRLYAYNTDYAGIQYMLCRHNIAVAGKTVLILGSGGTRQTAEAVLRDAGAGEILVASRGGGQGRLTYEAAMQRTDVEVLVNCSPVGMYPDNGGILVDLARFPRLLAVVDAVYNPFKTALVLAAEKRGVIAVGGLEMLVAQAVAAWELFRGCKAAEGTVEQTHLWLLEQLCNVSLVGMPGSGKTSLGKTLAKQLGKRFVDLDDRIVALAGMSIPEIFAKQGESAFRQLEAQVAREAGKDNGQVLATGGGIVLGPANIDALRQNGPVLFIDCPPERLSLGEGRPLAKSRTDLEQLYAARLPLYRAAADGIVEYHPYFKENTRRIEACFHAVLQTGWADGWETKIP